MNIKVVRNMHLYLGCFFAPLLLFFIVTGAVQTFNLHHSRKDGYKPPQIVKIMSGVHQHQSVPSKDEKPTSSSVNFKYFVLAMSIGIVITTILGIMMAFKFAHPLVVWLCLLAGGALPVYFLFSARGF